MKKIIYIFGIIFLVLMSSCEKTLDFPFEYTEPKLVLNCILTANKEIDLNITRSMHVLDSKEIVPIEDADVLLYEEGNLVNAIAQHISNGDYHIAYKPKSGKTYKVVISHNKFKTIEAEVKVPLSPNLKDVNLKQGIDTENYNYDFTVELTFTDPAESEDYYLITVEALEDTAITNYIYGNHSSYYDYIYYENNIILSSDTRFVEKANEKLYFSDEMLNGTENTIKLRCNDYLITAPFEYLMPNYYYGDTTSINAEDCSFYEGYNYRFVVHFTTINKDYYQYLFSYNNYDDNFGNPFSEPTPVRTNIKNGLGILGTGCEKTDTVVFWVENPYVDLR